MSNRPQVQVALSSPTASVPLRRTPNAAGLTVFLSESLTLAPKAKGVARTDVQVLCPGFQLVLFGSQDLALDESIFIDSTSLDGSFPQEICFDCHNFEDRTVVLPQGTPIGLFIVQQRNPTYVRLHLVVQPFWKKCRLPTYLLGIMKPN